MKLKCVQSRPGNSERKRWEARGVSFPEVGTVYTFRAVIIEQNGVEYLGLKGIRNPGVSYGRTFAEAGFPREWFREVREGFDFDKLLVVEPTERELREVRRIFHPGKRHIDTVPMRPRRERVRA